MNNKGKIGLGIISTILLLSTLLVWSGYSQTLPQECTDSDGGKEYYKTGTTQGYNPQGELYQGTDVCGEGTYAPIGSVVEHFCDGNQHTNVNYQCPAGCFDGACSGTPTTTSTPSALGSILQNYASQPLLGYLTIKVQKKQGSEWQDTQIVVDRKQIRLSPSLTLPLDTLWSEFGAYKAGSEQGTYRVEGKVTDKDGAILIGEKGPLSATASFEILDYINAELSVFTTKPTYTPGEEIYLYRISELLNSDTIPLKARLYGRIEKKEGSDCPTDECSVATPQVTKVKGFFEAGNTTPQSVSPLSYRTVRSQFNSKPEFVPSVKSLVTPSSPPLAPQVAAPTYTLGTSWVSKSYALQQHYNVTITGVSTYQSTPVYEAWVETNDPSDKPFKLFITKDNLKIIIPSLDIFGMNFIIQEELLSFPLFVGKKWNSVWTIEGDGQKETQILSLEVVGTEFYDYVEGKEMSTENTAFLIKVTLSDGSGSYYFHYVPPEGDFPGSSILDSLIELQSEREVKLQSYYTKQCWDSDGGVNYYTSGEGGTSQGEKQSDQCLGKQLQEISCQNNALIAQSVTCSAGCREGACAIVIEENIGELAYQSTQTQRFCNILENGGCTFSAASYSYYNFDAEIVGLVESHQTPFNAEEFQELLDGLLSKKTSMTVNGNPVYLIEDDFSRLYLWNSDGNIVAVGLGYDSDKLTTLEKQQILENTLLPAYLALYPSDVIFEGGVWLPHQKLTFKGKEYYSLDLSPGYSLSLADLFNSEGVAIGSSGRYRFVLDVKSDTDIPLNTAKGPLKGEAYFTVKKSTPEAVISVTTKKTQVAVGESLELINLQVLPTSVTGNAILEKEASAQSFSNTQVSSDSSIDNQKLDEPQSLQMSPLSSKEAEFDGYIIEFREESTFEKKSNLEGDIMESKQKLQSAPALYRYTLGTFVAAKTMYDEYRLEGRVESQEEAIKQEHEEAKQEIASVLSILDQPSSVTGSAVQDGSESGSSPSVIGEFTDVFNGIALDITDDQAEKLKGLPQVRSIIPNYRRHPLLNSALPLIGADKASTLIDKKGQPLTGKGITVAVLDSGIDYTHPDLGGCTTQQILSSQCAKVVGGYDFVNKDNDPMDDLGHGTHVAGIIAGTGAQSSGLYKGVAPDATLVAYKVCDKTSGCSDAAIIAALEMAANPDGNPNTNDHYPIVSLSLGGPGHADDALSRAVDTTVNEGVVAVVAAGNSGPSAGSIASPGTARKAVTVGSSTHIANSKDSGGPDTISSFSSRGPVAVGDPKPDLVAPGGDVHYPLAGEQSQYYIHGIISTYPVSFAPQAQDDLCFISEDKNRNSRFDAGECLDNIHQEGQSYIRSSGTSMATPVVSGAVALLLQKSPALTPQQVKDILKATAKDLGVSRDAQGAGRLEVMKALESTFVITPATLEFGEVRQAARTEREIKIQNLGTTDITVSLSFSTQDTRISTGVGSSSVVVPASSSKNVTVFIDVLTSNPPYFETKFAEIIAAVGTEQKKQEVAYSVATSDLLDGFEYGMGTMYATGLKESQKISDLAALDYNLDGRMDVAVAHDSIDQYKNTGNFVYDQTIYTAPGRYDGDSATYGAAPLTIATGFLNGDSLPDYVVGSVQGDVRTLMGTTAPLVSLTKTMRAGETFSYGNYLVLLREINLAIGYPQVLITAKDDPLSPQFSCHAVMSEKKKTLDCDVYSIELISAQTDSATLKLSQKPYESKIIAKFGQAIRGANVIDYDTDGDSDFIVGYSSTSTAYDMNIELFTNDGKGVFTHRLLYSRSSARAVDVLVMDYDKDMDYDIFVSYNTNEDNDILDDFGNIDILVNQGNAFTVSPKVIRRGELTNGATPFNHQINLYMTAADYDNDGDLDIKTGDNSGKVEFFANNAGTFTSKGTIGDFGTLAWGLGSADFDNDGFIDFVVAAHTDTDESGRLYFKKNFGSGVIGSSILQNKGTASLSGTILLEALRKSSVSGDVIERYSVYRDSAERVIAAGSVIDLAALWNKNPFIPKDDGFYEASASLLDKAGNVIVAKAGPIVAIDPFNVTGADGKMAPQVVVTSSPNSPSSPSPTGQKVSLLSLGGGVQNTGEDSKNQNEQSPTTLDNTRQSESLSDDGVNSGSELASPPQIGENENSQTPMGEVLDPALESQNADTQSSINPDTEQNLDSSLPTDPQGSAQTNNPVYPQLITSDQSVSSDDQRAATADFDNQILQEDTTQTTSVADPAGLSSSPEQSSGVVTTVESSGESEQSTDSYVESGPYEDSSISPAQLPKENSLAQIREDLRNEVDWSSVLGGMLLVVAGIGVSIGFFVEHAHREHGVVAQNLKVQNFIINAKRKGYKAEVIRRALTKKGWSQNDIDSALGAVEKLTGK